jgi:putative membrane protein
MRWWCSALGLPWSWTWRPYAGVWVLALALGFAFWRLYRRTPMPSDARAIHARRWRTRAAVTATTGLWLMLDWPVGTLGAGYLTSVHTIQYLGLALAIPALALLGLPAAWEPGRPTRDALRFVTTPPFSVLAFNAIVLVTHLPWIVDGLMGSQLGSFALDLAWLVGGGMFWWPVIRGWPEHRLGPAVKLIYLLTGSVLGNLVGIFLVLASSPLYRTYELAPPIHRWSALDDQQAAGALMVFGGTIVAACAVAVLFYLWQRSETARAGGVTA